MFTLRKQTARPEGMLCLMFSFPGTKVRSPLAVMSGGSVNIAGHYWKYTGKKTAVSIKWKDQLLLTNCKQTFEVYRVYSGVNSRHEQVMVVAWRKCGRVLSK